MWVNLMNNKLNRPHTLLTEQRVYKVDSISKKALTRRMESTRSDKVQERSQLASRTQPIIIDGFKKFFSLGSKFPVMVEFINTGLVDAPVDETVKPVFTTGTIFADDIKLNKTLSITVFDPDVGDEVIKVVLFNVRTGETEEVTLVRTKIDLTMFTGSVRIVGKLDKGNDFDGAMCAKGNDVLRILYNDARAENGLPKQVSKDIRVHSALEEPTLTIRNYTISDVVYIHIDKPVAGGVLTVEHNGNIETLYEPEGDAYVTSFRVAAFKFDEKAEVKYTYDSEYGEPVTLSQVVKRVREYPTPKLIVPDVIDGLSDITVVDYNNTSDEATIIVAQGRNDHVLKARAIGNTGHYKVTVDSKDFNNVNTEIRYYISQEGSVAWVERSASVVLDLNPEVPEVPEEPEESEDSNSIIGSCKFLVNGLFTINGSFKGTVRITPVDIHDVACDIILAD